MQWGRKWLPVAWLATWGLAVMSAAVPYWWVIGLLAIGLWELTWQMSGTNGAPVLSLERVNRGAIQSATLAAIALFALFWVCVTCRRLPVYGEVPAGKVLWSVLVSPITEELFFRGLMYNGFLFVGRNLAWKRAFEIFVMLLRGVHICGCPRSPRNLFGIDDRCWHCLRSVPLEEPERHSSDRLPFCV